MSLPNLCQSLTSVTVLFSFVWLVKLYHYLTYANACPQVWTVYLGTDCPPSVRIVHQSLSGREHTFCLETSKRSVYLVCRSDLELNRWIDRFVLKPCCRVTVCCDLSFTWTSWRRIVFNSKIIRNLNDFFVIFEIDY